MKNIYLATCIRLISHLGGSSIATVIVLEESPGPILLFVSIAMYFFLICNNISWITMVNCICIMFV